MPNFPSKHKKKTPNSDVKPAAGGITALNCALYIGHPHYALFTASHKSSLMHLTPLYREKSSDAVDGKYGRESSF